MKVLNPFKDMTKEQLDAWDDISVNSNKPILKKISSLKKGDKIRVASVAGIKAIKRMKRKQLSSKIQKISKKRYC